MFRKTKEFTDKAQNYDVAMLYYAGHGIQEAGVVYLCPTDLTAPKDQTEADFNLTHKTINLNDLVKEIEQSKCKANILVIDACRNNPFKGRSFGDEGVAEIKCSGETLIAFSVNAGDKAIDGYEDSRNSPYTTELLKELDIPKEEVYNVFKAVGSRVWQNTKLRPSIYGSLYNKFYFNMKQ